MSETPGKCSACKRDGLEIVATGTLTAKDKTGRVVAEATLDLCDSCVDSMTQESLAALRSGLLSSVTLSDET